MLPGRGRDADRRDHRDHANPALADAVALNSVSAAASTRPSLQGGPVSWTPTGRPSSSKPTGTARRRQAREILRDGERQHAVAEGLRRRRRAAPAGGCGSASAAGRPRRTGARSRRGSARGSRSPRRTPSSVTVRARSEARARRPGCTRPGARGTGRRGRARPRRSGSRRTRDRCARPPRTAARSTTSSAADRVVEGALDAGLERVQVQVGADGDPRLRSSRACARPVSAS